MARIAFLVSWILLGVGALAGAENLVVNPSFAEGSTGWSALWTREAGSGATVVVPAAGHDGAGALRVSHRGAADWSIEQSRRVSVQAGEVYALSAWVEIGEGSGSLALSVVTRDTAGEVMAWEHGRQSSSAAHDPVHLSGRFLVPDGCASISLRFTGSGPLVAVLSEVDMERVRPAPVVTLPAHPIRIAAGGSTLEWDAQERRLTLTAADGQAWTFAGLGSALPVRGSQTAPDTIHIDLMDAGGGDVAADLHVEQDGSIRCAVTGAGAMAGVETFPGALRSVTGQQWVLPINEGLLVPAEDPHFSSGELVFYGGHGLCMPFIGLVAGERGLIAIVEAQDDAVAIFTKPTSASGSTWTIGWQPSRGMWAYPRVVRLVPVPSHGYVGIAKAYRAWAQRDGRLVTLREKAKAVSQVEKLIGAVDVWWWQDGDSWTRDPHPEVAAAEMKKAGIERVLWSQEGSPEAVTAIRDLGFLPGRYDIYQDVWPTDTPIAWARKDGWPDDLVLLPDGSRMNGWVLRDRGTDYPGGVICAKPGLDRLHAQVRADLSTHPYGARFLDTTTASPLRECWNPRHPLSRGDDRVWKVAQLRAISGEFHLVCGSETGMDLAAPVVHYFEGMMSLGPYRLKDAGYDLFSYRAPQADFLRFQIGPYYRIPLFELVYHDCVVSYWYWGDASNRVPEAWDDRDCFNALYGTPPVFVTDRKRWDKDAARYLTSYQRGGETARRTGWVEMTEHAFLSDDHTLQRSRFADGTTVWANFSSGPVRLEDGTMLEAKRHRLDPGR